MLTFTETKDSDAVIVEPLSVRVPLAVQISGISQSELYRRAGAGELTLRKVGSSTVVDYASLKKLVQSLPVATIKTRA